MIEIDENEQVIMTVRKHWFVLLLDIFFLIFLVLIPPIVLLGAHFLPIEEFISFTAAPFYAGGFFLFIWLIFVWMIAWQMWTNYYLDVLLVTDKRIFDIEQEGFFKRKSGAFRIDRIQNVSVEVKGIIQTLLDFGTIRIETAGEHEDFVAPYIGNPYAVKKFISELQDKEAQKSFVSGAFTQIEEGKEEIPSRSDGSGL